MDYNNLESSKFYSHKFKNFSTMIILPIFILVLILLIGSLFAIREDTIKLVGVINPTSTLSVKSNPNYFNGQVIKKGKTVTLNNNKKFRLTTNREVNISGNSVTLFPQINSQKSLQIISYIPNDEISLVERGQKIKFQVMNHHGENIIINGTVDSVAIYPKEIDGKEGYLLTATIYPKLHDRYLLRYGMQSKVSVIISKETYFNYLKDKLFDIQ